MAATHHAAFSNSFNVRERARMSRILAEAVDRQTRGEKHQRVGLWEPRRSLEAKQPSAGRDE